MSCPNWLQHATAFIYYSMHMVCASPGPLSCFQLPSILLFGIQPLPFRLGWTENHRTCLLHYPDNRTCDQSHWMKGQVPGLSVGTPETLTVIPEDCQLHSPLGDNRGRQLSPLPNYVLPVLNLMLPPGDSLGLPLCLCPFTLQEGLGEP